MANKEVHFYATRECCPGCTLMFWDETQAALDRDERIIHTIQMGFLAHGLIGDGYDVFIHEGIGDGDVIEINHETGCARIARQIRPAHNLFKMWKAGSFS